MIDKLSAILFILSAQRACRLRLDTFAFDSLHLLFACLVKKEASDDTSFCYGADDGNRTHTVSLEGWSSTTKLHLHLLIIVYHINLRLSIRKGKGGIIPSPTHFIMKTIFDSAHHSGIGINHFFSGLSMR